MFDDDDEEAEDSTAAEKRVKVADVGAGEEVKESVGDGGAGK